MHSRNFFYAIKPFVANVVYVDSIPHVTAKYGCTRLFLVTCGVERTIAVNSRLYRIKHKLTLINEHRTRRNCLHAKRRLILPKTDRICNILPVIPNSDARYKQE